jgi:hypothetical protein
MDAQAIGKWLTLGVGLTAMIVTAWKGQSAWATVDGAVGGLAILVGTLAIVPAKYRAWAAALETALGKAAPAELAALKKEHGRDGEIASAADLDDKKGGS